MFCRLDFMNEIECIIYNYVKKFICFYVLVLCFLNVNVECKFFENLLKMMWYVLLL